MELRALQENEVLKQLLDFAGARKKSQAEKLIEEFGSLKEVLDAEPEALSKFVSDKESSLINFVRECATLYLYLQIKEKPILSSPKLVSDYLSAQIGSSKIERLYALLLNNSNCLIKSVEIEVGTVNKAVIQPRRIAEIALFNHSSAMILAHNHPSGTLKPSQDDIDSTRTVKEALKTVDILLHDHIIIAQNDYFSFREFGLI
jgi:DNA repair protein RadC